MSTEIDVPRLRQLALIVRHRSFSKAAESVGISQPALSKNIRSLERALGVQLLERGRFGAIPTAFGLALVRHADSIDAELRSATQEIEALRVARGGHTCIGCGPSEATRLLPMALSRLRESSPGIQVTILYGLNAALMPMVKHGEVDFALSSIPARCPDPDLKQLRVHEDRAAVIARRGHPLLARREPLTASDLVDQHWILATKVELERLALDQVFMEAGIAPPEDPIETTSAVLMKTLVMQSDFLTFLPRELVYWEERAGFVAPLNLIGPSWHRNVGVTMRARAGLNPAAQVLIKTLQEVGKEFET
ncbi:MAG TPA: LysR family transcriptional regulator [Steroidobacteraceae bacterium]|jgi:DNA-binding transcriptional LysR family regulator|nr:LysR family transcriptional regulator [Steroidobacteraceae bacterium]